MSVESIESLQRYLRRLCDEAVPPEDGVLLNRFVTVHDRDAFELLIARHGPMVLGTARRLVDRTHDAEDVFQAVFLSLARLAKTIRHGCTLPAWLHKTTCRVAARVRKNRLAGSTEPRTEPCENVAPEAQMVWQEVRQALDEELQRLPERLRSPLLLCYLSGLSRDEAAKQLGWSLGTLKRRLDEGRKALRIRLDRRGIAAVGLALSVLVPETLQATVSNSLFESTLGLIFSTGTVAPATISALVLRSATTTKGLAMKSIFALLAAVAVGVGIYAGMGKADPPKDADGKKPADGKKVVQMEDPLPAGAALRIGTSRFRYGSRIKTLSVSPDGKMAFVANDGDLPCVFDLATGRRLFSLNWGGIEVGAFSPDGRTIVAQQGFDLCVFDAATGKALRQIKGPLTNTWSHGLLVFTPDGKAVAVTSQGKFVHLIEFESGKTIRDFSHENPESSLPSSFSQVLAIAFSPDGKLMASGGYATDKDNYFARLWDVETGKELRRFMHGKQGSGIASLAFSPDGKTLATLGTQAGVLLRLFDVDTGKLRRAFQKDDGVRPDRGSVAFSPDGKTVAAATNSIRLYDTTTGEERLRIDRRASDLHFTDGGKTLTAAVAGTIYRWDTATGKSLIPDAADSSVASIFVTPDGSRVITCGQYGEAHIWDGANGKHLRRFPVGRRGTLAMSPDGRFLAWPVRDESAQFTYTQTPNWIYDGSRIRVYDIAADKFDDRFPAFKGDAHGLAFTSDGKKLVTADGYGGWAQTWHNDAAKVVTVDDKGGMLRIWDFESGKVERSFALVTDALKKKSYHVAATQLSAAGKAVVVTYVEDTGGVYDFGKGAAGPPHETRVWDVATGTELPKFDGDNLAAFSPDGRLVLTRGNNSVWEMATGKRVAALADQLYIRAADFSPDGRYLALALPEDLIQIWEVATWTKRNEFKGNGDHYITLTFGPGGRLFTGHNDTTVLVWDTRSPHVANSVSLDSAWNDLATREASVSFQSEERFSTAPADTVKLFAEKIQPATAIDPKSIQRWLADLGSNEFAVREAATQALCGLDHRAIPYVRDTLKTTASAEVRERAKKILEHYRRTPITTEQLRQNRAVLILERIGDDESKKLLKKWADGPAGALLTEEASAAIKRLEAVSKANR